MWDDFVSTLTTQHKLSVTSAANACICLRHFLRFLYRTMRIGNDLAPAVIGPTLRQMLKRPPENVSWTEIKRVLGAIDRTRPLGKRDFAIFITAASYGWGAADILSLRLDDIDWYRNTVSIVRPKTGVRIEVPLRPQVAHALAAYIQTARPANTGKREVFLRHYAPWAKVPTTNSIATNLQRYAEQAGISLPPRCKMKVFRCAHIAAQTELRGSAQSGRRCRRSFRYTIALEVRRHRHRTTEAVRTAGPQMKNGYRSRLANELQDFLEFKRSLGIQYDSAEWVLRRFDRFVAQTFKGDKAIDLQMAIEGWLATFHCRPVTITNSFLVVRKFCLFLRRRDPDSFVPDRDLAPRVYESHHLPHIFSRAEIRILLEEIGKMHHPFRSRTYRALLLILYCTGLRTGEAVRLRIRDVDLREKVLRVEVS